MYHCNRAKRTRALSDGKVLIFHDGDISGEARWQPLHCKATHQDLPTQTEGAADCGGEDRGPDLRQRGRGLRGQGGQVLDQGAAEEARGGRQGAQTAPGGAD